MEGGASISKVSVEYHDPFGVFPLVARQLHSYLPLRDLHWKSPTRPLRSIDSLHVGLVAAQESDRPASRHETPGTEHSSSPARTPGERRHQIPGLRQTPYLKVFLLRCDDNETYRSTVRKTLREWLKAHTPASQSSSSRSSQENHDAFEWLIIHVVLPNTAVASQPRTSGASSKSESITTEKSGTSSKLLGRSSTTILEKIKADFNVSSKSALDRVEQVRLRTDELPTDAIPPKPQGSVGDYPESAPDSGDAWQAVMNKLKTLILSSFSLRVSQYEDDIRERDAQRALPGWNFCTFFMLKEGLLRGFESVGLVDDALIGYDELSLGLENAMTDGTEDGMTTRSDSFLKYTKEMKDILLQCLTSESTPDVVWKSGTQIISTARKDYRNLIVNSNVSQFDFQSYIFARQMSILLRMSTPVLADRTQQSATQARVAGAQNIAALSELCQRATSFISAASRTLKAELLQAATAQGVAAPVSTMDNIVASFGFAVAEQVLLVTKVPALEQAWDDSTALSHHQDMDRLQHPERKSSLPSRTPPPQTPGDPVTMLKHLEVRSSMRQRGEDELSITPVTEFEILAGSRADLLFLQRNVTERIASKKGWAAGASRLRRTIAVHGSTFTDVDLADPQQDKHAEEDLLDSSSVRGILYSSLLDGLSSFDSFCSWYEKLTNLALMQCVLSLRLKAAEQLCADLAVLRYDDGDFNTALSYLCKIVQAFANRDWDMIETELVSIYLRCLKKLNRKDNYVRMALSALSKAAGRKKLETRTGRRNHSPHLLVRQEQESSKALLDDILDVSADLPCNVIVPMSDFFVDISVDPYIQHFDDRDGFSLELRFRFLLNGEISANIIRMKLKCIEPPYRELWLEKASPTHLALGPHAVELGAQNTCSGSFAIDKIVIIAKKIRFEAEMRRLPSLNLADEKSHSASDDGSFLERLPHILCYPTDKCLVASINASRDIHINKTRLLEIELQTGRNIVQRGQLNLRAASAGLRLITAEAIIADEAVGLTKGKEPGTLDLANLDANSSITISLPYDLESNLSQITISLDFRYTTSAGTFQYLSNPSILVDLALDVNVHDLFRDDVLFSRFQIRASRGIPLLVSSVQLSDTNRYAVEAPPCELTPMLVLPRQDGIMLYKIKPKGQGRIERQSVKIEEPLQLSVKYLLLDESVLAVMQQSLLQALDHSSFGHLKFLLRNALAQLSRSLSHGSLEELALLNEFHLPDYEVMGWSELLDGLQPSVRQELATWLRQWHKQNRVLSLAANKGRDESTSLQRLHTIKIDVPLPRLQILHTASLSLPSKGFVSQGSVLTANVSVYHTRRWETRSSTVPTMSSRGQELDFSLEVDAPPDVWLLGGDRRTSFVSLEAEVKTFELLLVPLKTGRLLLPEVIVRWNGQSEEEVRCETDFRSAGETVVVAADVKSTSVGLNEMVTGTEIMLMASERRR